MLTTKLTRALDSSGVPSRTRPPSNIRSSSTSASFLAHSSRRGRDSFSLRNLSLIAVAVLAMVHFSSAATTDELIAQLRAAAETELETARRPVSGQPLRSSKRVNQLRQFARGWQDYLLALEAKNETETVVRLRNVAGNAQDYPWIPRSELLIKVHYQPLSRQAPKSSSSGAKGELGSRPQLPRCPRRRKRNSRTTKPAA